MSGIPPARVASAADEFYVGYLPMPPRLKSFVIAILITAVASLGLAAIVIASQQSSAGGGNWEFGVNREFVGTLVVKPYPLLIGPHPFTPRHGNVTYVVVSEGKHGSADRLASYDGRRVRLKASLLDRTGRFLLELSSDIDAITVQEAASEIFSGRPSGRQKLCGEIIDPKCYLGAMKPGGGRTHRACATLCIRGGIPPMFVTRDENLQETYYLLTNESGNAILEEIVPFIGEPVELQGDVQRIGDLNVLRVERNSLKRI
ncbi:MAG: hypothetical protein AB7N71_00325 [Phycisphaerae bacterium]